MSRIEKFVEIFKLPPAMVPYAELVATDKEMDLVIGLGKNKMTIDEIAAMLEIPVEEASEVVRRAVNRAVVAVDGWKNWQQSLDELEKPLMYKTTNFHELVVPFAAYENEKWAGVPREARDAVSEWQIEEYLEVIHKESVAAMRDDPHTPTRIDDWSYILLEEALEMVDAAEDHAVVSCDCRPVRDRCNHERENCIRLGRAARLTLERGVGRRLTKEETRQIVINANMAGLMQTADRYWKEKAEPVTICNCCTCCCFPTLAGIRAGLVKTWPWVLYVAERDPDLCSNCGICVQRCGFAAFFEDEFGKVQFNADECRGCGICATGCPEAAIKMVKLRDDSPQPVDQPSAPSS